MHESSVQAQELVLASVRAQELVLWPVVGIHRYNRRVDRCN